MSSENNLQIKHILLSDLHLADGQDPSSKNWGMFEQFFFDHVFDNFVNYLILEAQRLNHQVNLVLLGDVFDFLHTPGGSEHGHEKIELTESDALIRLEKINTGHSQFFKALGRLISTDHKISILPGNHDAALLWPAVQEKLSKLIFLHSSPGCPDPPFTFYPWFFYLPGVIYAEHGQQYHNINAFTTLLKPFSSQPSSEIEETLGACLDRRQMELSYSHSSENEFYSDRSDYPLRAYLKLAKLLGSLPIQWRFVKRLVSLLWMRTSQDTITRRMNYLKETLPEFAQQTSLPSTTLESIDRLSQVSNIKILQQILYRRIIYTPASSKDHYLYHAVEAISELLKRVNRGVPYYVFGHSHLHQQIPLGNDPDNKEFFLNTGSWAMPLFTPPAVSKKRIKFPYVSINQIPGGLPPEAKLMIWNENRQQAEPAD